MPESTRTRMPEEVGREFGPIRQAVVQLNALWNLYTSLRKPEHLALIHDTAPDAFGLIMVAVRNEITMAHGRLLDPAATRLGGELIPNLSRHRLIETTAVH